eukprot:NODE_2038_length_1009_cov_393.905660.p1 GENE.NODE_2038_length_1009_cov_393.905660~~NODE_2038_length_1009_cov_393.905660.p1  ORF type:complete len:254 (+),score=51.41 NODE_2038_length_1009_cov_393.905660:113-874(+)
MRRAVQQWPLLNRRLGALRPLLGRPAPPQRQPLNAIRTGCVPPPSAALRHGAWRMFSSSVSACARCGHAHNAFVFVCEACGALMPAEYGDSTHFSLLGAAPKFETDVEKVDETFKALQRVLHPDRHAVEGGATLELAEAHTTRLNEAVSVLRSPLKRACYWMELNGHKILEEDQRITDMATMMTVMEVSEAMDEARTQAEIDRLTEENKARVCGVESELAVIFQRSDFTAARPAVERLQMFTRIGERLDDWRA